MRCLLAATALTPVVFGLSAIPAAAETVISTAVTTPVLTGTANDDLRISSTGSVIRNTAFCGGKAVIFVFSKGNAALVANVAG